MTRELVERRGARWFVLSALHGLIEPHAVIAPYEYTLNEVGVSERRQWAQKVLGKLFPLIASEGKIILFAGQRYREFLIGPLKRHGLEVTVPMEHLTQGRQLSWLSEQE